MPPRPAMPLVRAQCTIGDGNRLVVPRRGERLASWFQSGAALRRFRREHPTQVTGAESGHMIVPNVATSTRVSIQIVGSVRALGQSSFGLGDEFGHDRGDRFFARHHPDTLTGHQRSALDVAFDDRAPQRAGPEMFNLELSLILR